MFVSTVYYSRDSRLLAATLMLVGLGSTGCCSVAEESIRYTTVSERFRGIEQSTGEAGQILQDSQKLEVAERCIETARDISGPVNAYARGSLRFAALAAPAVAVTGGIALALLFEWLSRRRRVGWANWLLALLGCYAAAGVGAWGIYCTNVLPTAVEMAGADRMLRELKRDGWIPATKDLALQDNTTNCVDRLNVIKAGREDDALGKKLEGYEPLYKDIEALPVSAAGVNRVAYWEGVKSRATDAARLLDVALTWQERDRPLGPSEVLRANPQFRDGARERWAGVQPGGGPWYRELAYLLIYEGVPGGLPTAAALVILFVVPVTANLLLLVLTRIRKQRVLRRLTAQPVTP